MASHTQTSNGYTIDLQQRTDIGCVWTVRTYKKILGFKRLISSDWFLNREQADLFALQLATELERGTELIKKRRPGWILRRPAH
ncbi:MAG: hypothetical protein IPI01_07170 [Ignavibacteriae bacterium]|nr:hypothetical protein [Ignavibacteriota bacterium]